MYLSSTFFYSTLFKGFLFFTKTRFRRLFYSWDQCFNIYALLHMASLQHAFLMRHGPFLARLVFSNEKACYTTCTFQRLAQHYNICVQRQMKTFTAALMDSGHVPNPPSQKDTQYSLSPRRHDRIVPQAENSMRKTFLTRRLYNV